MRSRRSLLLTHRQLVGARALTAVHAPGEHGELDPKSLERERHASSGLAGGSVGKLLAGEPKLESRGALTAIAVVDRRDAHLLHRTELARLEERREHGLSTVPGYAPRAPGVGDQAASLVERRDEEARRVELRPRGRRRGLGGRTEAIERASADPAQHPAQAGARAMDLGRLRGR